MPSSSIMARFGATVRSFRYRLDLSQEELAERADLHRTYIAGIERGGRNITLKSLDKLARGLGVSTADLLPRATETPPMTGGSPLQRVAASHRETAATQAGAARPLSP